MTRKKRKKPDSTAAERERGRTLLRALNSAQTRGDSGKAGKLLEAMTLPAFCAAVSHLSSDERARVEALFPDAIPHGWLAPGAFERTLLRSVVPFRLKCRLICDARAATETGDAVPAAALQLARVLQGDADAPAPDVRKGLADACQLSPAWRRFVLQAVARLVASGRASLEAADILKPDLAPSTAAGLVEALGGAGSDISARLLDALLANDPPPALRQAIRKSLYRLREAGYAAPVRKEGSASPALQRADDEALDALVSQAGALGQRHFFIPVRTRYAEIDLLVGTMADRGVAEFVSLVGTAGQTKSLMRSFRGEVHSPLIAFSSKRALALLEEAHSRGEHLSCREYVAWRKGKRLPSLDVLTDAVDAIAVGDPEEGLADPLSFFENDLGGVWLADPSVMEQFYERIVKVKSGPLVLPEDVLREKTRVELDRIVSSHFDPQCREVMARKLEEAALGLAASGKEDAASRAVVTARAIRNKPPEEVAFLRSYVQFLAHFWEEYKQGVEDKQESERRISTRLDEGSIVTPDQLRRRPGR